ncbi:MAG: hypothetical protein J5643_04470 [Lachnospiraceae bacterium]|nr:hypothetical protein [Lachnospiraceae bacterium]
MLYLFTAIHPEAAPVVSHYAMQKTGGHFGSIYRSDEAVLVLTGSGPVQTAAAVAEALSCCPPGENDILVNLGICGAPDGYTAGQCFRIHKLTDAGSGRDFYPDIMMPSAFPEAALVTVSKPCPAPETLVDMEGAAFYMTASKLVSSDRIFVYKIVSDHGTDAAVLTPQRVTELVGNVLQGILSEAEQYASALPKQPALSAEAQAAAEKLCEYLDASVTMKSEIMKLAFYLELRGADAAETIRSFLSEEGLSDPSGLRRKEGKHVLKQFRQYCLR